MAPTLGTRLRLGAAAASVLAIAAVISGPAHAAEFRTSVSPQVLTGKPPWTVTYQVEVEGGPEREQIELFSHSWAVEFSGAAAVVTERELDVFPAQRIGCPSPLPADRPPVETEVDLLDLPANSQTVVRLPLVINDYPQLGAPMSQTFAVNAVAGDGTRTPLAPITVAGPALAVPETLDMGLSLPKELAGRSDPYDRQAFRLLGWADRATAGQYAEFRYSAPGKPQQSTRIAKVRIGPDGHFAYVWRPAWGGSYEVHVRYRSQEPRFATSNGECSVPLTVKSPPPRSAQQLTITSGGTTVAPKLGTSCLPGASGNRFCIDDGLDPAPTRRRLPIDCGARVSIHTGAAARGVSVTLYRIRNTSSGPSQTRRVHATRVGDSRHEWVATMPAMQRFNVVYVTADYLRGGAGFSASAMPGPSCRG